MGKKQNHTVLLAENTVTTYRVNGPQGNIPPSDIYTKERRGGTERVNVNHDRTSVWQVSSTRMALPTWGKLNWQAHIIPPEDYGLLHVVEQRRREAVIEADSLEDALAIGQHMLDTGLAQLTEGDIKKVDAWLCRSVREALAHTVEKLREDPLDNGADGVVMDMFGQRLADKLKDWYQLDQRTVLQLPLYKKTLLQRAVAEQVRQGHVPARPMTLTVLMKRDRKYESGDTVKYMAALAERLKGLGLDRHASIYNDRGSIEIDIDEKGMPTDFGRIADLLERYDGTDYTAEDRKERMELSVVTTRNGDTVAGYPSRTGSPATGVMEGHMYRYALEKDSWDRLTATLSNKDGKDGVLYTFFPLSTLHRPVIIDRIGPLRKKPGYSVEVSEPDGRLTCRLTKDGKEEGLAVMGKEETEYFHLLRKGNTAGKIAEVGRAFTLRLFGDKVLEPAEALEQENKTTLKR